MKQHVLFKCNKMSISNSYPTKSIIAFSVLLIQSSLFESQKNLNLQEFQGMLLDFQKQMARNQCQYQTEIQVTLLLTNLKPFSHYDY